MEKHWATGLKLQNLDKVKHGCSLKFDNIYTLHGCELWCSQPSYLTSLCRSKIFCPFQKWVEDISVKHQVTPGWWIVFIQIGATEKRNPGGKDAYPDWSEAACKTMTRILESSNLGRSSEEASPHDSSCTITHTTHVALEFRAWGFRG